MVNFDTTSMRNQDSSSKLRIYAGSLSLLPDKFVYEDLLKYISLEKRNKVRKLVRLEDVQRTLIAEILVRNVLCSLLGCSNSVLSELMIKNPFGKPMIKNNIIHYNLSHAGRWVVMAVDSDTVGIDVERVMPIDMHIAKLFFSPTEYYDLISLPSNEQIKYFYSLWTLKESYVKADGRGLTIPLNSFEFRLQSNIIFFYNQDNSTSYHFKQYHIDKDYKLSVCAKHTRFPEVVQIWNESFLIDFAHKALYT